LAVLPYCFRTRSIFHHPPKQNIKLINTDSLLYLPLADATVITFLAPSLACWACSFLINEPFTRMEQIAAYISLFGVVLIARPFSFFAALSHPNDSVPPASGEVGFASVNATTDRLAADYDSVTPTQRATAVGVAMLGVLGATGAYTTIRWIGKRAHPLISVNYFATWCTIVSIVAMFTIPGVGFLLPHSLKDWCYLLFLGVCGFVMVTLSPSWYTRSTTLTRITAIPPRCRPPIREIVPRDQHGLHTDVVRVEFRQTRMGHYAWVRVDCGFVTDLGIGDICCYA
jgi:drug/metabolite transporter (DMT)-like permease